MPRYKVTYVDNWEGGMSARDFVLKSVNVDAETREKAMTKCYEDLGGHRVKKKIYGVDLADPDLDPDPDV